MCYTRTVLNVRKLAAIDLHFLGPKFILVEFALGLLGLLGLGMLTLRSGMNAHSIRLAGLGAYMVTVGVNYLPLLLHAIEMAKHGSAHDEIAAELRDRPAALRKYRRQSITILIPFAVLILAMYQELERKRVRTT